MYNEQKKYPLPVSDATKQSGERMMGDLQACTFEEHTLTNTAKPPFWEKQGTYLSGYARSLSSLNHCYLLQCRGDEE